MLAFVYSLPVLSPRYAKSFTTSASGVWSGSVPTGMLWRVQPMTAGEFNNSISVSGTTCTVTFRKFRTGGLGLNIGTLLSVSIFEDSPGAVVFNLFGEPAT